MYSIILKNGRTINVEADLEWPKDSRIIRLTKDNLVVGVFNADNIAGLVDTDYKVEKTEADYKATKNDPSGIDDMLSNIDRSMGYALESDHRSFSNREDGNSWLFDKIIDWRRMINCIQRLMQKED